MKATPPPQSDASVLFGGVPGIPGPEIFEAARKNNPPWIQALETAYEKFATLPENVGIYADPKGKGASVEQVWLVFALFGVAPYCLLARPVPQEQLTRISRLKRLTAKEIVECLKEIQLAEGEINASTLHYDGRTGHCIRITSYDCERNRFIYHDPWPLNSLLCSENNMAGVSAQPEGTHWSVTAGELERVLFASFVFPHSWARLQGVKFDLFFDEWRQGEFFTYFHLRQSDERSENGMTRRMFSAGNFKDDVTLMIEHKASGKITKALLMLDAGWISRNQMLALDIIKSFVVCFAPVPDRDQYGQISQALWSLRDPRAAAAVKKGGSVLPVQMEFIDALMGGREQAGLTTDFGNLSLKNVVYEQEQLQELEFFLS